HRWSIPIIRIRHPSSVRLNVRSLDYLTPLLGLVGHELGQLRRRGGKWSAAQFCKAGLNIGISEAGIDFFVKLIDDLKRRVPRRTDSCKNACFIPRRPEDGTSWSALGPRFRKLGISILGAMASSAPTRSLRGANRRASAGMTKALLTGLGGNPFARCSAVRARHSQASVTRRSTCSVANSSISSARATKR